MAQRVGVEKCHISYNLIIALLTHQKKHTTPHIHTIYPSRSRSNSTPMPCHALVGRVSTDVDRIHTPEIRTKRKSAARDNLCVHHRPSTGPPIQAKPRNTRFGNILSASLAIAAKPNRQKGKRGRLTRSQDPLVRYDSTGKTSIAFLACFRSCTLG